MGMGSRGFFALKPMLKACDNSNPGNEGFVTRRIGLRDPETSTII